MKIIANFNKTNKKFLPMLSLVENLETTKKAIKKQIIEQIINDPETLKAYKNLEIYSVGETDDEMTIINTDKEKVFTYEELLEEIIEDLTKTEKGEENE